MATALKKVLLVDDDGPLRMALADQLALHEEFETSQADSGAGALEALDNDSFDAVLLDVGLPDMDGREVCRTLRRKGIHTPVIMLTALEGEADTILGLDSGANDYVTKPFRVGELLARLRTHLRQYELSEDAAFPVGPYTFRPADKVLLHISENRNIALSDKENSILKYLYRAGDSVVSCDTLYSEVWDYSATLMTHTLQTHIYRLRQKMEEHPSQPAILVSEPGGYRLVR